MSRTVRGCLGALAGAGVGVALGWLARSLPPLSGSHPDGAAEWLFIAVLTAIEGFSIGKWGGARQIMLDHESRMPANENRSRIDEGQELHHRHVGVAGDLPRIVRAFLAAVEGATGGLIIGWVLSPLILWLGSPVPAVCPPLVCAIYIALLWVSAALWGLRNLGEVIIAMDDADDNIDTKRPHGAGTGSSTTEPVSDQSDDHPEPNSTL